MRGNMYPQHYNPPYNGAMPNLGYSTGPSPYAPPPGPPPRFGDGNDSAEELSKPPGYDRAGYDNDMERDTKENPFTDFEGSGGKDTKRGGDDEFNI